MVIEKLVFDALIFDETSNTNIKGLNVYDSLALIESILPNFQLTSDHLDFVESIKVNKSFALSMGDALVFADSGSKGVTFLDVADILIFADEQAADNALPVGDTLVFAETLNGYTSKLVSDSLAFVEAIGLVKSLNLTVADALVLRSSDNGFIADVNFIAIPVPSCG